MEWNGVKVVDGKIQVGEWRGSHGSKYGLIKTELKSQLSEISTPQEIEILCDIELVNGEKIKNVCCVSAKDAFSIWSDLYFYKKMETQIDIEDVKIIVAAQNKLPEKLSKQIAEFWETGMGYVLFYFVFNDDERELAIHVGRTDCFDFGQRRMADVTGVMPFDRENDDQPAKPSIEPIRPRYCFYNSN